LGQDICYLILWFAAQHRQVITDYSGRLILSEVEYLHIYLFRFLFRKQCQLAMMWRYRNN